MDALDAAIQHRGVTWNRLCVESGVSPSNPSKWKKGEGQPSLANVVKFCHILDTPLEWVLTYAGDPPPAARTPESLALSRLIGSGAGQITLEEATRVLWDHAVRRARRDGQDQVAAQLGPLGAAIVQFIRATEEPPTRGLAPTPIPAPPLPEGLMEILGRELNPKVQEDGDGPPLPTDGVKDPKLPKGPKKQ